MKNKKFYIFFACLSLFCLFFISSSTSPFYNVFWGDYTGNQTSGAILIGKNWLENLVPYKDLFGTCGPLFYLIQSIGYYLGGRTGIFILQVINFSVFLCISFEILCQYMHSKTAMLFTSLLVIPYIAMSSSGNSDGEWCLCLIAFCFYKLLKIYQKEILSTRQYFFLGLSSGAILMICFRTTGIVFGISLFILYSYLTSPKEKHTISVYLFGIFLIVLPFIIYFISQNALSAFCNSYFFHNIKELLIGSENWNLILRKIIKCMPVWLLLFAGILGAISKNEKKLLVFALCISLPSAIFMLLGQGLWHYYLPMIPFLVAALALLFKSLNRRIRNIFSILFIVCVMAIWSIPAKAFLTYITSTDMTNLEIATADIQRNMEEKELEEVFIINSPASLYLALNQTPSYKYFAYHKSLATVDSKIYEDMYTFVTENYLDGLLIYGNTTWMQERIGSYQMVTVYSYGNNQNFAVYLYDNTVEY